MHSQFRFIKQVLYDLKRKFGTPITLQKKGVSTRDFDTGKVTVPTMNYAIRRAAVLPLKLGVLKQPGLGLYADITKSERIVLLDMNDLPSSYTFDKDDIVIINNARWNISKSLIHEELAIELLIKEVEGSPKS